jgi:competence protein ComEA
MESSWLDRNRHFVFVGALLAAVAGGIIFYFQRPVQEAVEVVTPTPTTIPTPAIAPTPSPAMVRVYITGAVQNPDVYVLPQGSIIKDAVQVAGDFTSDADPERINLALELADQQQIHIPRQGEENPPPPVQGGSDEQQPSPGNGESPETGGKINLNTATPDQLDTLPGIGPAIAQRIIDYREKIGGFKTIEQITEVSGIGEATFAKIKDAITVE